MSNTKVQSFDGWDVILDGGEECQALLNTQGVDDAIIGNLYAALGSQVALATKRGQIGCTLVAA